jgi:hypothetical protein
MAMTCNVGGTDKAIRVVAGIALLALALFANVDTVWKVVVGVLAAIALVTALIGFCPLNSLLGIDTCKRHA